ncbi:MAG: 30S ribosomal protein S14 [Alphaproteobacteria bacterium]|nr:30S ribosomal protein S14 [Alphaproteobacteria bacterium]
MAKKSVVRRNDKRARKVKGQASRRADIKARIYDKTGNVTIAEKFQLSMELAGLSRDGSRVRYARRCRLTGRKKGYFRKFNMSRIKLRDLAAYGQLPGVIKASW